MSVYSVAIPLERFCLETASRALAANVLEAERRKEEPRCAVAWLQVDSVEIDLFCGPRAESFVRSCFGGHVIRASRFAVTHGRMLPLVETLFQRQVSA